MSQTDLRALAILLQHYITSNPSLLLCKPTTVEPIVWITLFPMLNQQALLQALHAQQSSFQLDRL